MRPALRQIDPEPIPDDVPATVAPYVRAIGAEKAVELLLKFGGSEVYLSANPRAGSQLAALIGAGCVKALARELGHGDHFSVPLAKSWLARQLKARGLTVAAIARELRVTDSTVRGYLKNGRRPDPRQPRLL